MKDKKTIAIFTGGAYGPAGFYEEQIAKLAPNMVIAADRGAQMCAALGIVPAEMVGDFDSVDPAVFDAFVKKGVPVRRHPVHKDQTDTQLAIDAAIDKDATAIVLFGATGTRVDHTLASVAAMMRPADLGILSRIIDENNDMILFKGPREITFFMPVGTTVSLTALSDGTGPVTLSGFEYALDHKRLAFKDAGLSVSNVVAEETQCIAFETGYLLVDIVKEHERAQKDTAQ